MTMTIRNRNMVQTKQTEQSAKENRNNGWLYQKGFNDAISKVALNLECRLRWELASIVRRLVLPEQEQSNPPQ